METNKETKITITAADNGFVVEALKIHRSGFTEKATRIFSSANQAVLFAEEWLQEED
jgi:hypothetical protein